MVAIRGPFGGVRSRPREEARSRPHIGNPFGKGSWWVFAGIAIVGISALVPVIQSSMVTSEGFTMQRSQEQEATLAGQISILESEIGQMTSLGRIQHRALELGLQPSTDPDFIHVSVAGPAPAKLPSSYLPAPVPEQIHPESWWQSLTDWLPLPK